MNQKQKDLLCSMLKKRSKEISEEACTAFLLIPKDYNDWYGKQRAVNCIIEGNDEALEKMRPVDRKQYNRLKAKSEQLEKEKQQVEDQWDLLFSKVKEHCDTQKNLYDAANNKLDIALEKAIIKIQFAENANEAETILDSLPTVEQLISSD